MKKYSGKSVVFNKLIKEVAKELNITEELVWEAMHNFLSWQWGSFHRAEYAEYTWDRCFTFKWFNRTEKKLVVKNQEGWKEWKIINRHVKQENMLKAGLVDIEITDKHKQGLISSILEFHPSSITKLKKAKNQDIINVMRLFTKASWWNNAQKEGSWNEIVLKYSTTENLEKLLALLRSQHQTTKE